VTSSLQLRPALRLEVTAAIVLGVRLLALPRTDLDRELREAAASNPALLARELPCCLRCGRRSAAATCARCRPARPAVPAAEPRSAVSGWEQLRQDLLAALPTRLAATAGAVLSALDDRGLLRPDELTGLPADDVGTVLAALREVGPPGVGAATVEEGLLRQLDTAPLAPADRALARLLLTEHAAVLAEGGPVAAASAMGCPQATVTELLARLARLLRPFPGLAQPADPAPVGPPPDLVFELDGAAVRVVVPESEGWALEVDPAYRQVVAAGGNADQLAVARGQLRDAARLVDQVRRRWSLLARTGALLAEVHATALLRGSLAFGPLTQADAAARLAVHESTVSRAVRQRTARLPDGSVVPLRRLFGRHHDVRAAVAEVIRREPRQSDSAVAAALAGQGYQIARRTVAKYRHALAG
jgi:RNA polymerase sigma-54 factor